MFANGQLLGDLCLVGFTLDQRGQVSVCFLFLFLGLLLSLHSDRCS